jgi:acyl carrier protein
MTEVEVLARLANIVRDVLDNDDVELSMETVPTDVEGWDSLAHVSIVVAVERAFKVRFTTQQIEKLQSVGDIVRLAGGAMAG